MATDVPEEEVQVAEEAVETKKSAGFWIKFVAVAGLLVLVMVAQFVMLFFVFSSPENSTLDPNDPDILSQEALEDTDVVEVDFLSQFNCTNNLTSQGQTIHVTFDLHVEVPRSLNEKFIEGKKERKNRIREAVSTIIRNAGAEELNDPYLSMIKRQIREEINKILNQSFVTSVLITDYRTMEQ